MTNEQNHNTTLPCQKSSLSFKAGSFKHNILERCNNILEDNNINAKDAIAIIEKFTNSVEKFITATIPDIKNIL